MVEKREYHGFRLKQRKDPKAVSFFVFAALPEDIIKWSWVNRQIERPQGIQRLISPARKRLLKSECLAYSEQKMTGLCFHLNITLRNYDI